MMKSFSLAPVCVDGEGDDTAVRPSSTFRMLNFFIFPPGSADTTEDGAPETRLPGKDEDVFLSLSPGLSFSPSARGCWSPAPSCPWSAHVPEPRRFAGVGWWVMAVEWVGPWRRKWTLPGQSGCYGLRPEHCLVSQRTLQSCCQLTAPPGVMEVTQEPPPASTVLPGVLKDTPEPALVLTAPPGAPEDIPEPPPNISLPLLLLPSSAMQHTFAHFFR